MSSRPPHPAPHRRPVARLPFSPSNPTARVAVGYPAARLDSFQAISKDPLERWRHWGHDLARGTPLRWRLVREPSIHALHRLALETRPGLARSDPGSLAGRIQSAGVLVLQPLDQLGRRVVRGDTVLFSQPLALPQRPATQVRHEPQPDREVDVDIHAARESPG